MTNIFWVWVVWLTFWLTFSRVSLIKTLELPFCPSHCLFVVGNYLVMMNEAPAIMLWIHNVGVKLFLKQINKENKINIENCFVHFIHFDLDLIIFQYQISHTTLSFSDFNLFCINWDGGLSRNTCVGVNFKPNF